MKIELLSNRERQIKSCFLTEVSFHYPNEVSDFEKKLWNLQRKNVQDENIYFDQDVINDKDNISGEKEKIDKLIVMDNVSGLADKPGDFASFLTVAKKFGYSCVYIFHIFYLEKAN